jgi:hypothetical protein
MLIGRFFNDGDILTQTVDQLRYDPHKVLLSLLSHVEDCIDVGLSVSTFDCDAENELPYFHQ